jgi:hypothetical protein
MPVEITLPQFKEFAKNTDTRKNIIETNPGDKVQVVKPKTKAGALVESLRIDPKNFGAAFALDYVNKDRKKKGLEPLFEEDIKKDETTAGKEFQSAILGAGANIFEGLANILTIPVDYAFDTSFTRKLNDVTRKFVTEHGSPKTLTGDIARIGTQYGIPSTVTLKLVNQIPKLGNIRKSYTGFRKTLSNIENKFLRRSAKLGTSIARRSGQGGLALGAADALVAEPDRPTLFYEPVSEEGKTGRDLAAARFINKLKFGAEGATFGVGFALAGKALPIGAKYGLYKPGAFALGIGAKAVDKVVTPVSKVAARIPGIQVPFQLANRGGELLVKELGTRVVLPAFGQTVKGAWTAKLPDFAKWRTFSTESVKPLEASLKKLDNKLAYLRSTGPQTGQQYSLTTAARQEIKRAARRTEKLLESIEKRSYRLAKSFEGRYNKGIQNSKASQDYYLDSVLEFLKGQKTLAALPKDLQVTSKALKTDMDKIRKTFGDLLPSGDLRDAVLKNVKGYMRKSFAIFENPGYAVKETDPLFKKAQQFALNLVNGKGGAVYRVQAKKVYGGPGVSVGRARELQSQEMVREILRLGKVDKYDPIQNLNEIGKVIRMKDFIATGEELPTVIKNLLGQQNNLRSQVMTTISSMSTQTTNKLLFDRLAKVLTKEGILFRTEEAAKKAGIMNPVKISGAQGLGAMKTLLTDIKRPLYGASDLVEAITTSKGPLDAWLTNGVYKNLLQLKTGVQYGKTVLSPETQVRNFYSAMMFPLARGVLGGRASATDAIAMVADDIFNAGKGDTKAELRLLANIDEGIKYGVLDENIVASELAAVIREVRNGSPMINGVEGLAKFLEKNPLTEKAARLYAGGDNVWKWFTYNWYKSFTKDLFKGDVANARKWFREIAGREMLDTTLTGGKVDIDEAIRQAASWYTRNTIPTYSKVPVAIQALRRTPFGNFVSFPAEMLRTTFNNMTISMKEAGSTNPELRSMGIRALLGLYTVLGGASMGIKGLYGSITGIGDEEMDLFKQYFAPEYQANSNMLALTKPDKGKFKVVDLSDFIPQSVVIEPIEAIFTKLKEQKSLGDNDMLEVFFGKNGPVRTFFESYLTTPIGFEPFIDVARGETDTRKKIWSSSDSLYDKGEKSLMHILNVLEPGIVTSSQKFFDAIRKQPTPTGVVRETGDVIIGASTGLKPYNVDIKESLDYKISEFTRIRSDVFRAEDFYKFKDIRARGGDVIVEEFIDIQREAFRLQKDIYNAIQAAKEFGLNDRDIKKIFKVRKGISSKTIRNIMRGKFTPVNFSEQRFKKKLDVIKKREKELDFDYDLDKRFIFPKSKMKRVIRRLNKDDFDKPFYYDRPKDDERSSLPLVEPSNVGLASLRTTPEIKTPPLPKQPTPVVQQTAPNVIPNTGLTVTETALLSPDEQAIKLRQRGIG